MTTSPKGITSSMSYSWSKRYTSLFKSRTFWVLAQNLPKAAFGFLTNKGGIDALMVKGKRNNG